ncbi:hypothetical protein [Micromonospora arborensis]|uniref:hypothetical protein n=1 Tax=Micromonospora arborensis TaxID=2116518 RepID=UPI001FC91769|nr:hypothetical protein [Micromonospora arborensis]
MAWSIGHSLIVVLALVLGLAAGWLLRGRRGAQGSGQGRSIVDGDPVAGLAVISTPTTAATTDEAQPAAAVDPAPTAVADEPVPVDTVSAPAAVTAPVDPTPAETPSSVDPADMALTDAPPPVPTAEPVDATELHEPAVESTPEPVAVEEQPAPAAVVSPRLPADDLPADDAPAEVTAVDPLPAETPVSAESVDADAEPTRPVVATPPVRPTASATPPVRTAADTTTSGVDADPTGPADDFRRIQGIGPKMAAALQDAGVRTYGQLGELDEPALRDLIRAAGLRAAPGLASWPQQARVLAGAGDEMAAVLPGGDQS